MYDTYASLIAFREAHPQFFSNEADFSWKVSTSHWSQGRYVQSIAGDEAFVMVGNFDTREQTLTVEFPIEGTWRNYFNDTETHTGALTTVTLGAGEYRLYLMDNGE